MKLQTQIPLSPEENQIDYSSKILLMGSCFTENIGSKLEYFKFQNAQNPFGILFHPLAIENLVHRAVNEIYFSEEDVFERDGQWFSFEVHSSLTSDSKQGLVQLMNERLEVFSKFLQQASHIVFTYGTAWVYKHLESDTIVANCHKVPQPNFEKQMLSVSTISESMERTFQLIEKVNPTVQVILTVSPVRHLKDGFVENTRSKAHLMTAIHQFLQTTSPQSHPEPVEGHFSKAVYFPSHEIMMDELRDYRFYKEDLLHPNATAINYIWEKFQQVWIAENTKELQKQIDTIQKGLQHKPFNPKTEKHLKFQQDLQQKIERVRQELPFVDFTENK